MSILTGSWFPAKTFATIENTMKDPHIILTVGGGHCIEHAAMREYKRMTDMIMDSPGVVTGEQEAAMELLLDFLENADFAFAFIE